ncbi:hypothetical protein ACLB0R_09110 [Sphingomonas sp. GlSt437]|uniref:hypothetical protein n=1 Tax=Sphingomonas sp. GlSt437 TaxID=3389970 RepID=UPI003A838E96
MSQSPFRPLALDDLQPRRRRHIGIGRVGQAAEAHYDLLVHGPLHLLRRIAGVGGACTGHEGR